MRVLIIGSGGRAHAIGWKLIQRPNPPALYFAPGNAGTAEIGTNIEANGIEAWVRFAEENRIDLTLVGPEAALTEGVVDAFESRGLTAFGPDKRSAQLEGSKAFAKDFMVQHGVKTAAFGRFTTAATAKAYLKGKDFPIVIKASGLAAGKGVLIAADQGEAERAIDSIMLEKRFGEAGDKVVVEEFLEGVEASVLSFFNGLEITPFCAARDHKKIGEGDRGLNTGGMGVVAPHPAFTDSVQKAFERDVLQPTLKGLSAEKMRFSGVIFFGLMLTDKGVYLLEYNLRMGDPETQALLPLLEGDLLELIQKAVAGQALSLNWKKQAHSCCVVLASGGYPESYKSGKRITGIDRVDQPVFLAGVSREGERLVTSGGRVLSVTGLGADAAEARRKAYEAAEKIKFEGRYYRGDIGC